MFGHLMSIILFLGFDCGRSCERRLTTESTYAHKTSNNNRLAHKEWYKNKEEQSLSEEHTPTTHLTCAFKIMLIYF
jgi:hypothetical protein